MIISCMRLSIYSLNSLFCVPCFVHPFFPRPHGLLLGKGSGRMGFLPGGTSRVNRSSGHLVPQLGECQLPVTNQPPTNLMAVNHWVRVVLFLGLNAAPSPLTPPPRCAVGRHGGRGPGPAAGAVRRRHRRPPRRRGPRLPRPARPVAGVPPRRGCRRAGCLPARRPPALPPAAGPVPRLAGRRGSWAGGPGMGFA